MIRRLAGPRDPFEGTGARRLQQRRQVESVVALGCAIVACGVTAALWLRTLAPLGEWFGLG